MTENNRLAVPVILARKHWEAIIRVIEPEYQARGKDWQQWGMFVKKTIQANAREGGSPDELALVTLAEDNWKTVLSILEASCLQRGPEWANWAGNMQREIQSAIESARVTARSSEMPLGIKENGAEQPVIVTKPGLERPTQPEAERIKQAVSDLRDTGKRGEARRVLELAGGPAVEPLLASLKPGEAFELQMTVREILSQQGSSAVDALLTAFKSGGFIDGPRMAAEALGKIRDARAVEPLIGELLKANEIPAYTPSIHEKAQLAARTLAKIGDERAIEPLMQILANRNNHEIMRGAAIQALGELRAQKATELLTLIFNQGDPTLGRQAAEALGRIGGEHSMRLLISALKNDNVDMRVNAAAGLRKAADLRTVEALIEALQDPSWLVRNEAVRALGMLGDKRAVEPLISLLGDENFDVKWSTAMELGGFKDVRALPGLIEALGDPRAAIRRSTARSLGKIGDPGAVEALIAALQSPQEANLMNSSQEAAAEALGMIGDARAIAPLNNALTHANPQVQKQAAVALAVLSTLASREERNL